MQDMIQRRLIQTAVIAAIAGAGWHFGVRRLEAKYIESTNQLSAVRAKIADYDSTIGKEGDLAGELSRVEGFLTDLRSWSDSGVDPAKLYDAFLKLGEQYKVSVERVEPGATRTISMATQTPQETRTRRARARGATDEAAQQKATTLNADITGFRLNVKGSYEHVSDFISGCERDLGPIKVVSIKMSPAMGGKDSSVLDVGIDLEHVRFNFPKHEAQAAAPTPESPK